MHFEKYKRNEKELLGQGDEKRDRLIISDENHDMYLKKNAKKRIKNGCGCTSLRQVVGPLYQYYFPGKAVKETRFSRPFKN